MICPKGLIISYILSGLIVGLSAGFVFGLKIGYTDGSQTTAEIRNQILDIKPYDASLQIKDLEYTNITPSGFTVHFNTEKTTGSIIEFDDINGLVCEGVVYPSDIFTIFPVYLHVFDDPALFADIETYPEGGTVMFRIVDQKNNRGTLWFYINLPRLDNSTLPPPYMPTGEKQQ